ncbi:hypothetical protein I6A60_21100 [Frankia sp. AgB1.9]|uniref:hypothetical protein n=1 Tax=unclassified Frankia TaxID=2632575 RepID=UPI001932046E|nr:MULTISPECIES: hypothetical protein [unclassified Frankia]MBL7490767.1 hypothetical protein [Frankia sp. AgW1.1]MBL7550354.1 hypothetical protein [Frankia sp. AgB1.9]MBL7621027.1 hypothetical protein [Frankia sp. AgB1.8]
MPGPSERVVLDQGLARVLAQRLRDLRDLLGRWARAVVALLGPLGWPADPVVALHAGAGWADTSAARLTRRLAQAQAADASLGAAPTGGAGGTAAQSGGGGRLVVTLRPDPFGGDGLAARDAGARLGLELVGAALAPAADLTTLAGVVAQLRTSAHDPDFAAGLVGAVGPARLAVVLRLAEHVGSGGFVVTETADGYRVRPARGGDRTRADAPGRWLPTALAGDLTATLGSALATFSRSGLLTAVWLSRFNARDVRGQAETTLLGPLLAAGRFAPATLRLLGDALFATTDVSGDRYRTRDGLLTGAGARVSGSSPVTRDIGLLGADPAGRRRATYAAALLRAIADEPTLVARFATDHVEAIVAGARVSALPAPIRPGVPAPVASAWEYLVSRAGGIGARQADPAGAATFVARLGFTIYHYQVTHADPRLRRDSSWPLPTGLRAAIGDLLHVWRAELYASAVGLLPAGDALRGPSGRGLVAVWPAAAAGRAAGGGAGGPWSARLAGPADGARIPAELWAALLGEALAAGGPTATALGSDALRQAADLGQAGWAATRGYRGDGQVAYPASPRALVHLQQAAMVSFFLTALADTAAGLTLRAELTADDAARRTTLAIDQLAATARAVKVDDLVATLYGVTVGVTVAAAADAAKPDGRPGSEALSTIAGVAAAAAVRPGWQEAYRASATAVWLRRGDDPILPVEVTDAAGVRRTFTGDPRLDGFITGPADAFLDADGRPLPPERMSPAARSAYLRWLASPAIVANNDDLPTLAQAR